MAIAFARVSIHSRSKGHSAVAAASYRSGSRLVDSRTGITHDFSKRHDVIYSEIMLPDGADSSFTNRKFLWNQAEAAEKRKDAQVCKDIVLALPKELERHHQIELTRRFAETHFIQNGLPADISIHDHGDGNPHAHILIPTRRLEKNCFSKHKARDLNPAFAKGHIVEKDYWGEQWREMQNEYFQEIDVDLSVDLNHIIPERHEGTVRGDFTSYKQEENDFVRKERVYFALNDIDSLVNHISLKTSVFTRRELEVLIFKTLQNEEQHLYLSTIEKILSHKDVIALGTNKNGQEAYTTRNQYIAEVKLLSQIEQLQASKSHVFSTDTKILSAQYGLNEEQTDALQHIAQGSNISLLIGRPGVGKSYLLKPLKDYYETNNCRVIGTAISGKVAYALHTDTGMTAFTLAALTYRLQNKKIEFQKNDVVIMDEAGMVDFASMAYVVDAVAKAGAKLVLVGDPDQLKPIEKGEIFRGIAAHTGYVELNNIRRQRDIGDRQASVDLSKGDIEKALRHYKDKGAINFHDFVSHSSTSLVKDWDNNINSPADMRENVMFAFSRVAVSSLNYQARTALQEKGMIQEQSFMYGSERENEELHVNSPVILRFTDESLSIKSGMTGIIKSIDIDHIDILIDDQKVRVPSYYGSKIRSVESTAIDIAVGERILLCQNNKTLGVRNGDYASVESINALQMTVRLDNGKEVTIPKSYKKIEYGYATTVHKGQGMTVDNAWLLIDSKYWDRNLANVGMTRHRDNLKIHADRHQHKDMAALTKTLSRCVIKDNVIDWPLNFAIRRGFSPDKALGKAINYIASISDRIRQGFNYMVNPESSASKFSTKEAMQKADTMGVEYEKQAYEVIKKEFPLLAKYDELLKQRTHKTGYYAEKLDKRLQEIATDLSKNEPLTSKLKQLSLEHSRHIISRVSPNLKKDAGLER